MNKESNVDSTYLAKLYLKQGGFCNLTGLGITDGTMSIDRINSKNWYVKGNIQWVHITVNKMKSNFKQSEFIKFCKLVSAYSEAQPKKKKK